MNEILIHQIARTMNTAPLDTYKDVAQAKAVLALFVNKIQDLLNECYSAEENGGICQFTWKHEECATYMRLLYTWTEDSVYNVNR